MSRDVRSIGGAKTDAAPFVDRRHRVMEHQCSELLDLAVKKMDRGPITSRPLATGLALLRPAFSDATK
jgi:hypothetical protein